MQAHPCFIKELPELASGKKQALKKELHYFSKWLLIVNIVFSYHDI